MTYVNNFLNTSSLNLNNPIKQSKMTTLNFKGYIACPIKELYLQPDCKNENLTVARELADIGNREGFDICVQVGDKIVNDLNEIYVTPAGFIVDASYSRWSQDNKVFLESAEGEEIAGNGVVFKKETGIVQRLAKNVRLPYRKMFSFLDGGNYFIGKNEDGQKFALVGKESLIDTAKKLSWEDNGKKCNDINCYNKLNEYSILSTYFKKYKDVYIEKAKYKIAEDLNIEFDKVYYISQPDFHIDMAIRPLQYPFVLVNDPDLFKKPLLSLKYNDYFSKTANKNKELIDLIKSKQKELKDNGYATPNQVEKQLNKLGFKVIRVPGILSDKANFMNAIVHEKSDGSLVYITNKSDLSDYGVDLNRLFKDYIKEVVPSIKKIEFISGKNYTREGNFITRSLKEDLGGIHCMVAERPDFDKWG